MRHLVALKKLNVDSQHRVALRRNLARSLFLHGRIITTTAKAKAFRPFVERLVTRARKAWALRDVPASRPAYIHALRILGQDIPDRTALMVLVEKIAPLVGDRKGGYTRILRDTKNQLGDNAPRSIWEFVDRPKEEAPAADGAAAPEADGKNSGKKGSAKKPAAPAKGAAKAAPKSKGAAPKGGKAAPAESADDE